MRICFTGDSIMLTPPAKNYWQENKIISLMNECDVRCGNLEMCLSGEKAFASTFCGGFWLTAEPEMLGLLMKFGFDYFNTANNHTMDFSYEGLRLTNEALDSFGVLHSGSGSSLEEASSPVYLDKSGIRIAFLSCTASCDDAARAGNASTNIPARPGVNMLRHNERLCVTAENLAVIDSIAESTCINARFLKAVRMGVHSLSPEIHRLGRLEFVEGQENKKITSCRKDDLNRILASISEAKKNSADVIVINIHSHDIKADSDDTADYYLEEFAHQCINYTSGGGALIIGTGTHQLKGIEIYKGCPIFYSLGNFLFKFEHMRFAPHDIFERFHADCRISPQELWQLRSKNETVGLEFDPFNYRSVIPVIELENSGRVSGIKLVPIELGFDDAEKIKGFPYPANESVSEEIYCRLSALSSEYGTKLKFDGNTISINL